MTPYCSIGRHKLVADTWIVHILPCRSWNSDWSQRHSEGRSLQRYHCLWSNHENPLFCLFIVSHQEWYKVVGYRSANQKKCWMHRSVSFTLFVPWIIIYEIFGNNKIAQFCNLCTISITYCLTAICFGIVAILKEPVAYREGLRGFNPPPPKFRSFTKSNWIAKWAENV
jgi:hypothetical protein